MVRETVLFKFAFIWKTQILTTLAVLSADQVTEKSLFSSLKLGIGSSSTSSCLLSPVYLMFKENYIFFWFPVLTLLYIPYQDEHMKGDQCRCPPYLLHRHNWQFWTPTQSSQSTCFSSQLRIYDLMKIRLARKWQL